MRHYDRNGAQITCTATKAEHDAASDAPAVHFVRWEEADWGDG